ncbi:MAG TPA: chemotaxis protein CheB [Thermodesulfobacteriota bacterium]|nr:chemotaxis protein CheB [Thermodesulfobacteriota bacterium]
MKEKKNPGMMKKKPETASSSATFVRNSQPNSAVKKELVSTKLASRTSPPKPKSKTNPPTKSPEKGLAEGKPLTIVGVGASAGGLEAFTQLLRNLPSNTGMAFVLVQHLDPKHESMLTQLLSQRTKMPVSEAKDGMAVEPDHVYIIPPNRDMTISSRVLGLALRTEVRGHHMPIDQFFHSLAEDQKSRAIGVILSGTASDGAQGLRAIKAQGGITFAQDEKSAKYGGMPHSAVEAGAVDLILPPEGIARELVRISRHPYAQAYPLAELPAKAGMLPGGIRTGDTFEKNGDDLAKIFSLLQSSAGVDFTYYKRATVKRRILRRMALLRLEDRKDYVKYLRDNPSEVEALYHDVLINVTGFFRDPETFEALGEKVFPEITRNRGPQAPIRIWVPGCSTGEEAYSVAISLVEFLGKKAAKIPVQIFATDLSDRAINNARTGRYPESIARDFSPERLERFFVKADGSYQVSKSIREVCVFAKHDVTRDPPFSNLDLISCRNVMIYMGPVLQKRAMAFFHYALKPTGFLLLGKSEAIGRFPDLFAVADRKYKIYSKKPVPNPTSLDLAPMDYGSKKVDIGRGTGEAGFDIKKEVERIILSRYTPAGVVVNDRLEILDFHGRTGLYLEHSPGGASLNLLKMAREGIKLPLRTAIHEAKKQGGSVRTEGLQVNFNGHLKELTLEVIPVKAPHPGEGYFLILFEDAAPSPLGDAGARIPVGGKVRWRQTGRGEQKAEIVRLEQEIQATKKHLQSIIEEYEATNEELKAANEEVLSGNEELQSINEELETAKEELQSTNEELTTLNDELQSRNLTLDQLNFDMINLLTSVNLPVIMLGIDLCIRRFTPLAEKVLNLAATDIGRSILQLRLGIHVPDLETSILEVIHSGIVKEEEVQDPEGTWYSVQIRPYRTTESRIEGAVLTWINIDALKRSLEQARESRDYAEAIVETVREPLIILDKNLHVKTANRSFYQTFQTSPGETEGHLIYELGNHQWDIPDLRKLLDDILPRDTSFQDFEIEHEFPAIGVRTMRLNARRIAQNHGGMQMILLAIEDVTERRRAEQTIEQNEKRYRSYIEVAKQLGWITNAGGGVVEDIPSWRKFTGQSEEEVKGWGWSKAIHPDDVEHTLEVWRNAVATTTNYETEYRIRRHDGVYRHFLARGVPVFREDGTIQVWVGTCIDITERKRMEEALQQHSLELQQLNETLDRRVLERTAELTTTNEALRHLSTKLLSAQEDERRRIAGELHDTIGSCLTAIKFKVQAAQQEIGNTVNVTGDPLNAIMPIVQESIDECRRIQMDLRPSMLDDLGLLPTLSWFFRRFRAIYSGIRVEQEIGIEEVEIPDPLKTVIYRVIQEAMNNIAKHSKADFVNLSLRKLDERLELVLQDNGRGFDLEKADSRMSTSRGLGLSSMKERVELSLGSFAIESTEGRGTIIRASWPLREDG